MRQGNKKTSRQRDKETKKGREKERKREMEHDIFRGAQYLLGENLKVVWAKFSTLS
jgi:hypothetical protein